MIYYPLQTLLDANIQDIVIVSGREHMGDVMELMGSGKELGCDFTYKVQDEPGGIAEALKICHNVIPEDEYIVVILGDNVFLPSPGIVLSRGARVYLKFVGNASRFGVATITNGAITDIREKPKVSVGYAVTGLYIYDNTVWDYIYRLKPSKRKELEITDLNMMYLNEGKLKYSEVPGFWSDAGTFESMKVTQEYVWKNHA
jgi:glucose-1-phosphate thymidylyltransferase